LIYETLYSAGIQGYGAGIRLFRPFSEKAKQWVQGRKNWAANLEDSLSHQPQLLWFHAASLGEAEQGLPIMRKVKAQHPEHELLLTFFSPSGMQHFKHREIADHIHYLPLDSARNAKKFLEIVRPELAFFVKYEIWPHFFKGILDRKTPLVIAPAIFREDQFYFKKPHSRYFLPILQKVNRIMVQDEHSAAVLARHGISAKVVGDSRFDRVLENTQTEFADETLQRFSKGQKVLVGGSTWKPGEQILKQALEKYPNLKLIIAPHDISEANVQRVQQLFGKESFRYSSGENDPEKLRVCIIDNIGLLSRLYRFGQIAYVGGAFGSGIHNTLEAAAYGMPVFFGPKYDNFIEPSEMIAAGFGHSIHNFEEMDASLEKLLASERELKTQQEKAKNFVRQRSGSVEKIFSEVEQLLS